jgi:hypothetical protein
MAMQTHLSKEGMYKDGLFQKMPSWFDRKGCTFTENAKNVYLNFPKPCSCGASKQTAYVGTTKGPARAAKLAECFEKKHSKCAPTIPQSMSTEDVLAASAAEITRLDRALAVQKRKNTEFEAQNGVLKRKVDQGESDRATLRIQKRLKSIVEGNMVQIDPQNSEEFKSGMKSHCMIAKAEKPGGILATIEHWCGGSHAKLLTVVLDLIKRYDLEGEVAAELGAGADTIHKYIVERLRAALHELQKCGSEKQRREYRTVLTSCAPEHGRAAPVAAALGVPRRGKPFTDGIMQRAGIDETIKTNKQSVQIGDLVQCRHGVGKLIEYDSEYDSDDSDTESGPCAVEITIDGHTHVSRFNTAGRGKRGARLRRPAITFSPLARLKRKDAVSMEVEKLLLQFFESECATSPCAKDQVRKRLGPSMYIIAQKMYMLETYEVRTLITLTYQNCRDINDTDPDFM